MKQPKTNFQLYTDVVLENSISQQGLSKGDIGTVVEKHVVQGKETGYSVEFFDMLGNTVAVSTVPESKLRLPTHSDRPAVRLDKAA